MVEEDTKLIRASKILLKIDSQKKSIFTSWWHGCCNTYNRTLFYINNDDEFSSKIYYRNLVCSPENQYFDPDETRKVPYAMRSYASFLAHEMFKSALSNFKNGNIKHFKLQYLSKKSKQWSIRFDKRDFKKKSETSFMLYPQFTNKMLFETLEPIGNVDGDLTLHFNGKDYYMIIPRKTKPIITPKKHDVISIDPGIKTFLTTYSGNNSYKLGFGAAETIFNKKCLPLDALLSYLNKTKGKRKSKRKKKRRKQFLKRVYKIRTCIKNMQTELHYKTINVLCNEAKLILLPEFKVSKMVRKKRRRLRSKTVRKLNLLGHAIFRERLKAKAEECGVQVLIVTEHYTSQTCGCCGSLWKELGGRDTFKCSNCGIVIDRDLNGARNILLRAMRDTARIPFLKESCEFIQTWRSSKELQHQLN
jgi:putative transposase